VQTVISAITRVFEMFDDDDSIPAFGYGGHPQRPLTERFFPFVEGRGCELDEVLQRYFAIASTMELNASASFVPVIHEAIKIVKKTHRYHILIIISNGHIDDPDMARRAIVEASEHPICTCLDRLESIRSQFVVLSRWNANLMCELISQPLSWLASAMVLGP
jgi:E3 ubiquitin-protein ligase RGLG